MNSEQEIERVAAAFMVEAAWHLRGTWARSAYSGDCVVHVNTQPHQVIYQVDDPNGTAIAIVKNEQLDTLVGGGSLSLSLLVRALVVLDYEHEFIEARSTAHERLEWQLQFREECRRRGIDPVSGDGNVART